MDMIRARAAAILSSEVEKQHGWPVKVLAPSGSYRAVQVGITWHGDSVETTCQCRGSRNGLCYHQVAAVLYSLRHAEVSIAQARGNARRLARLGGYVLGVCPEDSGPELWLVVRTRNKNWEEQENLPGELAEITT